MSVLGSLKDVVVGQALKLAGNPRLTKLAGDPRIMNVAMKAINVGGAVKSNADRAGRFAAGVFGLATQEEVAGLRTTIQTLEDNLAALEAERQASTTESATGAGAQAGSSAKKPAKTVRS
jgi:hypothetical protein